MTIALQVGGKYNWRNQPERLVYMGVKRHNGDRRDWHQFALVSEPDTVWSEVLDSDLEFFEATPPVNVTYPLADNWDGSHL